MLTGTRVRSVLAKATVIALLLGAAVLTGGSSASACQQSLGINGGGGLVRNGNFERAVTEPDPVGGTIYQANVQPGLPDGWVFEGSAGLFDYADVRADMLLCARQAVSGFRFLAISIPASGKAAYCAGVSQIGVQQCVNSPAEQVNPTTDLAQSTEPDWRNAVPIAVQGGRGYTLSFWTEQEAVTINTGAVVKVRWHDALGAPIRVDTLYRRIQPDDLGQKLGWTPVSVGAGAPGNAAFAVILLGHSTDIGIGQVRYDNVSFG